MSALVHSEPNWQLTFRYGPDGLAIERAQWIPPTTKKVRTPGLHGAPLRLDYRLEWLDANGRAIGQVPVVVPLGTRGGPGPEDQSRQHLMLLSNPGTFVIRVDGPTDRKAVQGVRLLRLETDPEAQLAAEVPTALASAVTVPFREPSRIARMDGSPGALSAVKVLIRGGTRIAWCW